MDNQQYNTITLDHRNNFKTGGTSDDHILGKKGNDTVNGGAGNDILEGNAGDDKVNGGNGNDTIFGGVGNDSVSGGTGEDTFSMRVWRGGDNTIKDFTLGEDALELVFNRKHFVLEHDLVESKLSTRFEGDTLTEKVTIRENKIEDKLDAQVSKAADKLGLEEDIEDADAFVQHSVDNVVITHNESGQLILTFLGGGKLGTSIKLDGLAHDPAIAPLLNSVDGGPDTIAIMAKLTKPDVIVGSSNDDPSLSGTNADDKIEALAGNDTITGGQGNDHIDGGAGVDTAVFSGSVLDYHFQNRLTVTDTVSDRDGKDQLTSIEKATFDGETYTLKVGHNGYDKLTAEDGVDTLLIGAHGHDDLTGGTGNDVLLGDNGVGFTYKGGNDTLDGGDGDDTLVGGGGNDTLIGGEGVDTAVFTGSVSEYQFSNGLTVADLVSGRDGTDQLSGVEKATFSEGTYTILRGHNGYDNKTAQDGVDTLLIGADGHDDLTGGTGDDVLFGDNSISDTWNAGDDTLDGGAGNDMIFAGGGNDTIYGDEKRPAHLATNAENDIIDGGEGIDTLKYNETYKNADALKVMAVDSDTFNVDSILSGQITSTDTVSNVEILQTTRGDDVIDFSALGHGMTLQTLTGNDTVTGSGHDDVINVGIGNDTIIGSGGNDVINGGSGNDEIIYAAGTNISIEANGAAYKKEYKITNLDDDSFDIVSSIESISVENGVSYSLSDGEYSSLG
ncbi:hypothetical protein [Vibrio amylolyticus]|uniref:hypothetical protein n=1 Tax=Vibrio amylolyticus TaxID=2847292 RepID=UPI00249D94CB|nr:hypothetical protein [Vibrio amylolyticus]